MPTKRTRRRRGRRQLEDGIREYFLHGTSSMEVLISFDEEIERLWEEHKEDLISAWIEERPFTRPFYWWKKTAPQPRKKTSGKGVLMWEMWNVVPSYWCGIPEHWREIDPDDPPHFESQGNYLWEKNLLTEAEERLLRGMPEALLPESIFAILPELKGGKE